MLDIQNKFPAVVVVAACDLLKTRHDGVNVMFKGSDGSKITTFDPFKVCVDELWNKLT